MTLKREIAVQRVLAPVLAGLLKLWPERLLPAADGNLPDGKYPVGVCERWIPDVRPVASGSDGRKPLMLRIWYPAGSVRGLERRPVFNAEELAALERGAAASASIPLAIARQLALSATGAYLDAPLLSVSEHSLPVILYCHGLGMLVGSNALLCEHLASHGYLVVALAQAGSSGFVLYPDGEWASMRQELGEVFAGAETVERVSRILQATETDERERATERWSASVPAMALNEEWMNNLSACMDAFGPGDPPAQLADFAKAGNFRRVGGLGMSFGGSALASLAREDSRVGAVVNMDGGQLDTALMNSQIAVPLLMLHSNTLPLASPGGFNDFHYEPYAQAGLTGLVHRAIVDGAAHMDFSDWTLARNRLVRRAMGLGPIEGKRMSALLADCSLAFFDACFSADSVNFGETSRVALTAKWPELCWLELDWVRALAAARDASLQKPSPVDL